MNLFPLCIPRYVENDFLRLSVRWLWLSFDCVWFTKARGKSSLFTCYGIYQGGGLYLPIAGEEKII